MIKKAVVLCGGLATRFLPYCKSVPKEMLPLVDKPLIQVIVEQLTEAGITDIMIILGRNKECIVNHFDRNIELENRLSHWNTTSASVVHPLNAPLPMSVTLDGMSILDNDEQFWNA